jgi:selenocysteine lyase/cysteine desulfurase
VVFTKEGHAAAEVAAYLGQQDIYVWDGNYYAVEIMDRLGHTEHGMVRVGLAHYNTHDEIDQFAAALRKL